MNRCLVSCKDNYNQDFSIVKMELTFPGKYGKNDYRKGGKVHDDW